MSKFGYINEELKEFTKSVNKKEFEDKVLDCLYERHDYFHNYMESERVMLNEAWGTDFEYPEDLFVHLWEEKPYYFFKLIEDILFDAPIEFNEADEEIVIDLWDAIRHRMWYHDKF